MTQDPRKLLEQATQLARSGQLDKAMALAVQLPRSPVKYQFQVDLLINRKRSGDLQQAEEICAKWRESDPGSVQPLFQLMKLYWNSGQVRLTPPLAVNIGELEPEHQFTPYYQAVSQQLNGEFRAAIANHRLALVRNATQKFSNPELDLEVAIAAYEVAAGNYPASPGLNEDVLVEDKFTYDLLGNAIQQWMDSKPELGKLHSGQVIRYSNACYNLGCVDANRYSGLDRALKYFRNALQVNPAHNLARSNYLFIKNYDPDMSSQDALDQGRKAAAELRQQLGPPMMSWNNNPDPERVLQIAYLSSDFCQHSVVHFITPVLEAHNRESVQVHAYYTGRNRDKWTQRVATAVDQFHLAGRMTDRELHQKIVQDQIDILVDLNGFTRGHRVEVLMRRAAPVQVSWIGYPGSTGLDVMDYRVVDNFTDPEAKHFSSEKRLYMDPVFSVYLPDSELPDLTPETPALKNGFVTFGSFNALPKLNPKLLKMWGKILSRVDGSKLLIKNKMLDQPSVRRDISEALTAVGIDEQRRILLGRTDPPRDHMKAYQRVDLCLDSYPYNGTTTNCDSFVMGVPVLTLTGSRHASRVTTSQLNSLGLDMLIASNSDQYIDKAVQLASDTALLNSIRQGLRERMQESALMDYQGFTRQLEAKYREIWRSWCAEAGNSTP
jgi:predicted O-linked N-acetylglucosamine transferase (SPINDLY family)